MIGEILRREREQQKLTIQDVEQATSIRALYIEALEQGEYDKLPGEVYAKGFIKNYANFLNLNGDDMVKKFIMEISPATIAPEENIPAEKTETQPAAAETGTITKTRSQRRAESAASGEEDDSRKKYLVAAVAALILLIGGLVFGLSGSGDDNSVAKTDETQTTENPQIAQNTPTPVPETQPPAVAPPTSGVNVQATFSDDCWTQVVIDGALVFEGMINAGQVFDWAGTQSVYVVLGNAGAVNFVMNGQDIGAIGAAGAVVERIFTR